MEQTDVGRYICVNCGYIYDPGVGDPMNSIDPETSFSNLPASWVCPMCYTGREQFDPLD